MKKCFILLLLAVPFSSFAATATSYQYESECKNYWLDNTTKYSGKCSILYSSEAMTEYPEYYDISFGDTAIDLVLYKNGSALVNGKIPAKYKIKNKQITVTTGEGEVFVFDEE